MEEVLLKFSICPLEVLFSMLFFFFCNFLKLGTAIDHLFLENRKIVLQGSSKYLWGQGDNGLARKVFAAEAQ